MDKPLECSSCQEPIAIIYKQLSSTHCSGEALCKQCPVLKQKLEGTSEAVDKDELTDMSCEGCGTLLHDILRREVLGCAHCYEVFEQALCQRLNLEKFDYKQDLMTNKNSTPTSDQLLKLSKDLQEAVMEENFEKAALLRDEINKLKKNKSEN
jgi:protein arginine kinase activator